MPGIGFVAPVIRAAIATLQADLAARIAAFNLAAANQVDLASPAVDAYHFGGTDVLTATTFPQIEVGSPQGQFGAWSIDRIEVDHDPVVNVSVWQEGVGAGNVPLAYEASLGYTQCVIETLAPKNAFGPDVEIAQAGGVYWRIDVLPDDPTSEPRDFRVWRVPALIVFRLELVERFV